VRTQCYPTVAGVAAWWYARDATHLNFFAERTLSFAAGLWGLRCLRTSEPDIFIWSNDATATGRRPDRGAEDRTGAGR
jgi:hypothetical protein